MTGDGATVTFAEAEAMLPPGPVVHVLTQEEPGSWSGADVPRRDVLALLGGAAAITRTAQPDAGHGLTVLFPVADGILTMHVQTGERRDALHYAIGTYACHLAGQAGEDEVAAALARVPASQRADYDEITADIRARFGGGG